MGEKIINIGEVAVSNNPTDIIRTFALGSCIALIIMDPKTRIAGMVHIACPDSAASPERAKELPGYFADTAIDYLIKKMEYRSSFINERSVVKLVGGAEVMGKNDSFQIGKRNVTAIKKILWEKEIPIAAEDTGASHSRTVSLEMSSGKVYVKTPEDKQGWRV